VINVRVMCWFHKSVGVLRYSNNDSYRLVLEVDQEIADYYRSLLPKWFYVNRQKYHAHVSVVRHEVPVNLDVWGKYEGKEIEFIYTSQVFFGKVYYWLNMFCVELEEIRKELGLSVVSKYTLPPEGFVRCFHITIGNSKNGSGRLVAKGVSTRE
jgi:hypothetical protein